MISAIHRRGNMITDRPEMISLPSERSPKDTNSDQSVNAMLLISNI